MELADAKRVEIGAIPLEGGREKEIVACKRRQLNSPPSKPASSSDISPPFTLNTRPAQSIELVPLNASARSGRISIPAVSSAAQTSREFGNSRATRLGSCERDRESCSSGVELP